MIKVETCEQVEAILTSFSVLFFILTESFIVKENTLEYFFWINLRQMKMICFCNIKIAINRKDKVLLKYFLMNIKYFFVYNIFFVFYI